MELNFINILEHAEQMGLDSVRVASLTQDLQQRRVGHEEKPREYQTLGFQITYNTAH